PTGTTTQPVSGTVTANQGGAPWSQNVTQWNSTALANPFDMDTGAGTQNIIGVTLRKSASGGSVEYGTSSDPIRVDPTGTTTQPVSGTVTANAGSGTFNIQANASVNLAQVGGTSTVTGGVAGSQGVGGLAASGASKAGNPVQIGGVFNTTQPTVS